MFDKTVALQKRGRPDPVLARHGLDAPGPTLEHRVQGTSHQTAADATPLPVRMHGKPHSELGGMERPGDLMIPGVAHHPVVGMFCDQPTMNEAPRLVLAHVLALLRLAKRPPQGQAHDPPDRRIVAVSERPQDDAGGGLHGYPASSLRNVIHTGCRWKPKRSLMAIIGALWTSFSVLIWAYPCALVYSTVLTFSAVAIPRPRYSRFTPVSPCCSQAPVWGLHNVETPAYCPSMAAMKYASGMNQGASTVCGRHCCRSTGVNGSGFGTSVPSSISSAWTRGRQDGSFASLSPSVTIVTPAAPTCATSCWNRERAPDASSRCESHVRMTPVNPRVWTNCIAWARSSFTRVRTASAPRAASDCRRRSHSCVPIPRPHSSGDTRMVIPNFRRWKFQGRWRISS